MTVLLQDLLARAAASRPGATAVVDGTTRLIYSEIETASSRLAATLVRRGVEPGDRVGVLVGTPAEAFIAVHAVLKAGAVYVPLDPDGPADHLARIVCRSGMRLLLTIPAAGARLAEVAAIGPCPRVGSLTRAPVADLGGRAMSAFTSVEWDTPAPSPARRGVDTDPACQLFTAGTTHPTAPAPTAPPGDPCGVVVTQRMMLAAVVSAVRELGLRLGHRVCGHAPPHTGLAALDMFGAVAAGAELHVVPPNLDRDLRRLVDLLRDRELTHWATRPSTLRYVARFDALRPGELPALERVVWSGGPLSPTTLRYWTQRLPHVRFSALCGPPDRLVGLPDAVGAADSRTPELGLIERALNAVDHVCESAVVAVDTASGDGAAICAAYVTSNGLTPPKLRRVLAASVPAHLLPQRWLALDALPRDHSGTIDRGALRAGFALRESPPAIGALAPGDATPLPPA